MLRSFNRPAARQAVLSLIVSYVCLVAMLVNASSTPRIPVGVELTPIGVRGLLRTEGWQGSGAIEAGVFADLFLHSPPFRRLNCRSAFISDENPSGCVHECCSFAATYSYFNVADEYKETRCGTDNSQVWHQGTCYDYPTRLVNSPDNDMRHMAILEIGKGGAAVPGGHYVLLFNGTGEIRFQGDAALLENEDNGPGRLHFQVTPANGVDIIIAATDPDDHLRDFHIVPLELEHSFREQPFHPRFLEDLEGFGLLRFAGWQKTLTAWGDRMSSLSQSWDLRTLPSERQTSQLPKRAHLDETIRDDGVAVEYMVQLANELQANPWFCMPTPSGPNDEYITQFARYVADYLDPQLTVYVEHCSGVMYTGWDRLSARYVHSIFEEELDVSPADTLSWDPNEPAPNVTEWRSRLVRVVTTDYVPQVLEHFGPEIVHVDALAIPARFGTLQGETRDDVALFEATSWPLEHPDITIEEALKLIKGNMYVAELQRNREAQGARYRHQQALEAANMPARNLAVLAYQGGLHVQTDGYGHVATLYGAERCLQQDIWPCPFVYDEQYGVLEGPLDVEAIMDNLTVNAALEQQLQDLLIEVSRQPEVYDLTLEWLHRWRSLGGDGFIAGPLYKPAGRCLTGGKNCGNNGVLESPGANRTAAPKFQALKDYAAGTDGEVPLTAAAFPEPLPAECSACDMGTCVNGVCECWAGYAGEACDEAVGKPNDCTADVGTNIAGIADWSPEWTFVDIFKASRAWISQEFTSYTWSTKVPIKLTADDYPAELAPNQKVRVVGLLAKRHHIQLLTRCGSLVICGSPILNVLPFLVSFFCLRVVAMLGWLHDDPRP